MKYHLDTLARTPRREAVAWVINQCDPSSAIQDGKGRSEQRSHVCQGQLVDVEAETEITSSYDHGDTVWRVETGILRLQRHAYDGRRQILSLFLPGEVIGYEHGLREGLAVESVTRCRLCKLDRRAFDDRLATDPELRSAILAQNQVQLDRLRWLTWSIGALRPDERFCAFLAMACQFMPYQMLPDGSGVLSILLPRVDIADLLATSVETISRASHWLAEAAVIEIRDSSHFRIINRKRLSELGQIAHLIGRPPFHDSQRRVGRVELVSERQPSLS